MPVAPSHLVDIGPPPCLHLLLLMVYWGIILWLPTTIFELGTLGGKLYFPEIGRDLMKGKWRCLPSHFSWNFGSYDYYSFRKETVHRQRGAYRELQAQNIFLTTKLENLQIAYRNVEEELAHVQSQLGKWICQRMPREHDLRRLRGNWMPPMIRS